MTAAVRLYVVASIFASASSQATTFTQQPVARNAQASNMGMGMGMMMGGWHYGGPYGRQYFSGKDVTLEGTVADVGPFTPARGMTRGSKVILKTGSTLTTVHLGPIWYVQEQDLKLKKGDVIKVRGRQIGEGQDAIVFAAEIARGETKWTLRDIEGIPNWCAMRSTGPLTQEKQSPENSKNNPK